MKLAFSSRILNEKSTSDEAAHQATDTSRAIMFDGDFVNAKKCLSLQETLIMSHYPNIAPTH